MQFKALFGVTYFFLDFEAEGGGGGGGGTGDFERPPLPSFLGRPRGRLSLMEHVAAALANWALRPARVTGGGGPLFRGSWD